MGMAFLRALGVDATSGVLDPLVGLALFQALQVIALLGGGAMAGAGQMRSTLLGGVAGFTSGVIFLVGLLTGVVATLAQWYSGVLLSPESSVRDLIIFGLPLQHAIVGAVGGLIGGLIWSPLTPVLVPGLPSAQKRVQIRREATQKAVSRWTGPVSIVGVVFGSAVAVAGALQTPAIVDFILRASEYKLKIITQIENQVAYGEVYGLAILFGGFLAGANRVNGLKQGVCVGVLVAMVMTGSFLRGGAGISVSVIFPILSAMLLAPIGGLCGSELLPPAARRGRRHKKRTWL
jgi:hypothetical protein